MDTFQRIRMLAGVLALAVCMPAHSEDLASHSGPQLYKRFCASCHGAGGQGDGPVAPFFKINVPDITRIAKRHAGTFPQEDVRKIIDGRTVKPAHGSREMPVWGWELRAADTNTERSQAAADAMVVRLVEYVRSIQKE